MMKIQPKIFPIDRFVEYMALHRKRLRSLREVYDHVSSDSTEEEIIHKMEQEGLSDIANIIFSQKETSDAQQDS